MGHRPPSSELSRELTLFHVTMMGLGMMIGAGIFLGIGNCIYLAGPGGVLLTFLLNGIVALFTAFSYAELSSAIPRAGGAYNYARLGFGRGTGFVSGWMEWFASSVAGSLYAVTFGIYVTRYFDVLGWLNWVPFSTGVTEKIMAVAIAVFFFYINSKGASETGKLGAIMTLGQTLFLFAIGFFGIYVVIRDPSRLANFSPFLPHGWDKLLVTMGVTYVAFEGYEVIAQAGDEVIDPKQNLPKAMLYSVFIVTVCYILVSFATLVAVKTGDAGINGPVWEWIGSFRERGFGEAVARLMPFGNFFLTLAVIFAATSALNATIYSATRALYALGRDNMVPAVCAQLSSKRNVPWVALLLTAVIVLVVATALPTMDVASSASMMFLILFFVVNLSVIRIRLNMGDELEYGFIMPFFPLFPILAIIAQVILTIWLHHMSPIAWLIVPGWIIIGVIIYHLYSKSHALASEHEVHVFEDEKATKRNDCHIMVAVANPKNAIEMVRTTYKLCKAKDASVELLHMVPVPEQVPLSDADRFMWEGKEAIVEAMMYFEPLFDVSSTIRYCRNIARGIVGALRQKKASILVLGWHGKGRRGFNLGSTLDPIIERSPCDVVILKGVKDEEYKRILVPLAGGPNSAKALEIASILVDQKEGQIQAFTVVNDRYNFDIGKFVNDNKDKLHISQERIQMKAVNSHQVVDAILKEVEDYDAVVIGASPQRMLHHMIHESVIDIIARKCEKPLIMVKTARPVESILKRIV